MYKDNDYIIYDQGIGQIIDINQDTVSLLLIPTHQKIKKHISQIIRPICSVEKINEIIDRIAYTCTLQITSEKFREEIYQDAMKQYDELEWVKVIKSEYIRNKARKVKGFERKFAKEAKQYLYSEISILLNIEYNQVEQYIFDKIHEEEWE